jgi:hypothetical protein
MQVAKLPAHLHQIGSPYTTTMHTIPVTRSTSCITRPSKGQRPFRAARSYSTKKYTSAPQALQKSGLNLRCDPPQQERLAQHRARICNRDRSGWTLPKFRHESPLAHSAASCNHYIVAPHCWRTASHGSPTPANVHADNNILNQLA